MQQITHYTLDEAGINLVGVCKGGPPVVIPSTMLTEETEMAVSRRQILSMLQANRAEADRLLHDQDRATEAPPAETPGPAENPDLVHAREALVAAKEVTEAFEEAFAAASAAELDAKDKAEAAKVAAAEAKKDKADNAKELAEKAAEAKAQTLLVTKDKDKVEEAMNAAITNEDVLTQALADVQAAMAKLNSKGTEGGEDK